MFVRADIPEKQPKKTRTSKIKNIIAFAGDHNTCGIDSSGVFVFASGFAFVGANNVEPSITG